MDYYDENDKKTTSVLQSDEMFSSRILARQSTIGSCSSRIYYRPASEGVPFQWEKQPGKPIAPQPDDVLPPLSPPPAMLAMGLPKPLFDFEVDNDEKEAKRSRRWSKAWVVKNIKKKLDVPKTLANYYSKKIWHAQEVEKFGSERYYSESTRFSSTFFASATPTSSSINYSFSDNHHSRRNDHQSKELSKALSKEKLFTCNPRGFSAVVVYFVKRS